MKRWKATLAYDGTNFAGWQKQPGKRTIQGILEQALEKLHKGKAIKVTASGRTDASAHAVGQVVHFDSPLTIPSNRWSHALAAVLPEDIQVSACTEVPSHFHARFHATAKKYCYYVQTGAERNLFQRHYVHHCYVKKLNIEAMRAALAHVTGTHDFSSFCASNTAVVNKERTIHEAMIEQIGERAWVFTFQGNGFLYNMVRILVGTLLEIGTHRRDAEEMRTILNARDRRHAGKTAPGHGLYLQKVYYEEASREIRQRKA